MLIDINVTIANYSNAIATIINSTLLKINELKTRYNGTSEYVAGGIQNVKNSLINIMNSNITSNFTNGTGNIYTQKNSSGLFSQFSESEANISSTIVNFTFKSDFSAAGLILESPYIMDPIIGLITKPNILLFVNITVYVNISS
jgi:hypothetical protein